MRQQLIVILSLSWLFSPLTSLCQDRNTYSTVLWGILNKKGDTSYLFGTFHEVSCTFIYDHRVLSKTPNTNCLALETDPGIADSTLNSTGAEKIFSSDKQTWLDSLNSDEKVTIKRFLKKCGSSYKLQQFSKFPVSVFIYTIHNLLYADKCLGSNEDKLMPMEYYLYISAKKYNKEIVGLETVNENVQILYQMFNNDTHLLDTLKYMFKDIKAYSNRIDNCNEIVDYKSLNVDYQFNVPAISVDSAYDALLIRRNENWLPRLQYLIDNKRTFVAVGYKHLFYKEGLINLLRNEGYYLFPIKI